MSVIVSCKAIFREITEAMVAAEDGNFEEALKWINKAKNVVGETAAENCQLPRITRLRLS